MISFGYGFGVLHVAWLYKSKLLRINKRYSLRSCLFRLRLTLSLSLRRSFVSGKVYFFNAEAYPLSLAP